AQTSQPRPVDDKATDEAFARSKFFLRDLMAQRARHAILSQLVDLLVGVEIQMRENLALFAFISGLVARHRHVTFRAFVLDFGFRYGMVDRFATHAGLPIRITRGIRHHRWTPGKSDRDVFATRSRKTVVTSKATIGRFE